MHRKKIIFHRVCVSALAEKHVSFLGEITARILTLLVFMRATNGFTIANQPCAGAGDILDCVYYVSGVSAHTCGDHCFFSQNN